MHRSELVGFLTRRLSCRATAEDIVQDVFLRLSAVGPDLRHPRALLFKAAINLSLNHSRDERRRAQIRDQSSAEIAEIDERRDPERALLATDALRRLAKSLASWPSRTREVFILNRFDGLNQREIAERLGISSTSVEKHMARAIRKLAEFVAAEQD